MIKNERQYRITRAQVERFERTIKELRSRSQTESNVHPLIAKAQEDAVSSQLEDLKREMREYESLKTSEFPIDELEVVSGLASMLIKARIASGMSQRDLAERIGLKEQQIQRYEATDYASASLSRIREIVSGLSGEVDTAGS